MKGVGRIGLNSYNGQSVYVMTKFGKRISEQSPTDGSFSAAVEELVKQRRAGGHRCVEEGKGAQDCIGLNAVHLYLLAERANVS